MLCFWRILGIFCFRRTRPCLAGNNAGQSAHPLNLVLSWLRPIFFSLIAFFVAISAGPSAAAEPAAAAKPNRLLNEKSPYLRQHAYNPVDWFPWGEEAFAKARRENKPIFLSIGYATCHWCHVMERESFTDPAVAALLNANFVAIKVDREERPDLDRIYLTFVQASTGGGGWPLSVWLTPELKPFFGGTYFPPESQPGQPGFKTVLTRLAGMWKNQRDELVGRSEQIVAALAADTRADPATAALPVAALRRRALAATRDTYDAERGGFSAAPKFPEPPLLEFLLDVQAISADPTERKETLAMALKTLRAMAAGGLHDQLGGGFHRYSVDADWRVPHFEKMLVDQAQLVGAYLSAWQISADPVLRDAARDTLEYVRRDLTDPAGGFYSAEDADSEVSRETGAASGDRAEGAFYLWTAREIERALGPHDAAVCDFAFGVEAGGNAGPELAGRNVLYRAHPATECAAKFGLGEDAARQLLASAVLRLREARARRPRPLRDDKVVTAANGLMISAFARAAQVFDDPASAETAARAAAFLRARLFDAKTGRLARSYCAGRCDERGFAEDYAFLIQGLLDLYETTFDLQWLEWAVQLQGKQIELFWDPAAGGFFANTTDDASVLLRLKEDNDGAEPSSNSVAVRNLARLAAMLHRDDWRDLAARTARTFGPQLDRAPLAMPLLLAAADWLETSPQQVLIQGDPASPATADLVDEVWRRFLPRHVLVRIDPASRAFFSSKLPVVADLPAMVPGMATAYLCENFTCQLPTHDPAGLAKLLTPGTPAR